MNLPGTMPDEIVGDNSVRIILTSHSNDNLFDYCKRKWEFMNLFDRRPARDSGFAAAVGTCLHEGTQAWLIGKAEGLSDRDSRAKGFIAMFKWYPWEQEQFEKTSVRSIHNTIAMQWAIMESPEWDNWDLVKIVD